MFDQVGTLPIWCDYTRSNDRNRVWVGTGDKNQGCLGALPRSRRFFGTDGGELDAKNGGGANTMPLSIVKYDRDF